MIASVIATFKPLKMNGRAVGKRIKTKLCQVLARSERARSSRSGSTASSPAAVAITTGKKLTRNATMIFGSMPYPSQIRISGAMLTLGIDCATTSSG
jgi:hypothetical protein